MTRREMQRYQQRHQEIEQALDEMIEDTIATAGPTNALAWVVVALGGLLLNLGLLVLVTGG